jgi:D-cysteine desulfhydrase family pyridoxal phosphate-dependent enzyme
MQLPPRLPLGNFPTPLEPLPRLSAELGVEVLVKRDDLTGLALGGNKVRKLEMLLAEAVAAGADAVITCGSVQSNHCRCTAAAARKLGLECGLVLFEGRHNEDNGNLLLDHLFGAAVEVHPIAETPRAEELMTALGRRYRNPHLIPFGGSNGVGAAAYVWGYEELRQQLGGRTGTLFCVTSSGATHAGLAIGEAMLGGPRVIGVAIADPAAVVQPRLVRLIAAASKIVGYSGDVRTNLLDGYQGDGYGVPTAAADDAIRRLARTEGLLLDPVYTGKAMAALLAQHGDYEPPLIFLHSGGVPALFAYAAELSPGSRM